MHGFRGLNRDSFSGGWCSSWIVGTILFVVVRGDTTYGDNFYTFGPLSYSRNDGIWSSSQIMYGLWPKFFHFVPTFYLIGTSHGILTHWSDCVISHSSDSFVWSKSISQMLWKFKSLEQKIALELLKKTKKDDRYANNSAIGVQFCNFQTCWFIKSETCHNARFALFDGFEIKLDRWRLPYCWLLLHPRSSWLQQPTSGWWGKRIRKRQRW